MKIKKMYQGEVPEGKITNTYSDSPTDTYSCDYINDKKNKDKIKTVEPTMMNATVTRGNAWQCTYQYLDDHVIVGAVKLRGQITATSGANPWALIKLNIPNFRPDTWRSFAVIQEAYEATSEVPYCAGVMIDGNDSCIKLAAGYGIGTCQWKVTTAESFYVTAGFILFDIQS